MEDFIRVLVTPLLDYPENLTITMIENPNEIVYQLSAHSEDMGKIIGKQGRVAKSLRLLVQCAALRKNQKVYLEIC